MPKYLDLDVLNYAVSSLAQNITNNFAMRKNAVRKIEVVDAIPTALVGTSTTLEKCLRITYDDDGYVNKAGITRSHVVDISIDEIAKFSVEEWKDNTAYVIGDCVLYNQKMYKANTAHTSSTDFETDKANWDLVIGDENEYVYNVLDYSSLPTSPKNGEAYFCRTDYTDTSITPNVTYKSGLYYYDASNSKWVNALGNSSSGSGSAELEDDVTAIGVSIGSVKDGDTLTKGLSFTDFAKKILQKRIAPTYTAPSVSLKTNAKSVLERGSSATIIITPTFTQNDAGVVTGYELFRDGVSIYTDTSCSSYTDTISTLSGTSIQYTCTVTYADGTVKNDNMGDPDATGQILAGSKTASATKINIALKYYYGKNLSQTISMLSSLTAVLDTKKDLSLKFTADDEYLVLVYDSTYGNLSKIYDQNKFDNTSSWTQSTLTNGGFIYNVYATNNKVTCKDFGYDFKF